jgi:hypothetical protein
MSTLPIIGGPTPSSATTPTSLISYIPLTTTFTPPSRCSTRLFTIFGYPDRIGWDIEQVVTSTLTCYPGDFYDAYSQSRDELSSSIAIYSPGVCPKGYTTAKAWQNGAKVTFATCCLE